jgi:hypothetical protein
MSTTHTPGPWTWEGHTLRPVNRDPRTSSVYSILHDDGGGFGFLASKPSDTVAELNADRALIAAAPDLFEALETLYDALTTGAGRDFLEAFVRDAGAALETASPGWRARSQLSRVKLRARAAA